MTDSLPRRALRRLRRDGFRPTLATTVDYLSAKDPVGFVDLSRHTRDWAIMSRVAYNDYLRTEGWVLSEGAGMPVDDDGAPVPWYTYPCIDFLEARLDPSLSVFEYGSGLSTIWYARRVDEVVGVEHSQE